MNAERRQGLIFGCVACLATAAAGALGRCPPQLELIVLAALILVLGVPHGAMDTLFAQRLYGLRTAWDATSVEMTVRAKAEPLARVTLHARTETCVLPTELRAPIR